MYKKKKILVCPLDWGLGHAARCIPVIKELLQQDASVIIAADKGPKALLIKEFPFLEIINIPGYDIYYSEKNNMSLKIMRLVPQILKGIDNEHKKTQEIIEKYNIDGIISDNRYGIWSAKAYSVFVSHQIKIKCPKPLSFFEPLIYKLNKHFISKYNECWIPDFEDGLNFSGDLSHNIKLPVPVSYIGVLSRFSDVLLSSNPKLTSNDNIIAYDVMAIISGPEPQRSIFEKIIIDRLKNTKLKSIIVQGKPDVENNAMINDTIRIVSHLSTEKMRESILASQHIISRPGYSTIMDLVTLGKDAIFIPTPGQTEQEYLARFFKMKGYCCFQKQSKFNISSAIEDAKSYSVIKGARLSARNNLLKNKIKDFLEKC